MLNQTGIRTLRGRPVVTTPNVFPPERFEAHDVDYEAPAPDDDPRPANDERRTCARVCYICKETYTRVHDFYDQLCPACADVNFAARTELADLRGRVALLTGGRVKIGYQASLKLLRSGAHLIVTTRFPHNAAARYAQEADFGDGGTGSKSSVSTCATRPRWRRSAATSSLRASASTSSSTTPARPSGVRPSSTRT